MQAKSKKHSWFTQRTIILIIGIFFMLFFKYLPLFSFLTPSARQILGIFIGILILWLKLAIDWPSLLLIAALALVPEIQFKELLLKSIGSETFSFLLFTFICTYALSKTPFIRRCALFFVERKLARHNAWALAILFIFSVFLVGLFMSPTVLFVIYLPILEDLFSVLNLKKGDKFASMLMMGTLFSTGIATGATPIAHVFPIMALNYYQEATGLSISYSSFMAVALPLSLLCLVLMLLAFYFILRPKTPQLSSERLQEIHQTLPDMSAKEKAILLIFIVVITLWLAPDLLKPVFPTAMTTLKGFGSAYPPLIGVISMSIITISGEPLLNFKEAMSKGVPWSALIMAMGTLALGSALNNPDIAIMQSISQIVAPLARALPILAIVALFSAWSLIQTNLSSNIVTVTVVTTAALPIALSTPELNAAALCSLIGMQACYGLAFPPAMPTVALAIDSGWSKASEIAKYGLLTSLIALLICTFIAYPLFSYIL